MTDDIQKRNMASSTDTHFSMMPRAKWTDFSVLKSVKEGMHASGWVYIAVSKISGAVSSVPFVVYNKDGVAEWGHPISKLLDRPHPELSSSEIKRLLAAWLLLGGSGYLKKVKSGSNVTRELWPISPDRIAPIGSKSYQGLIENYEIYVNGSRKISSEFTPESVIRVCKLDPADPLRGLGDLRAAAKAVDLDLAQADWNKSLMQNRGSPDYAISFKGQLDEQQKKSILKSIKAKFRGIRNAGLPMVFGQEATITKLGLTQQEMDFLNSRKWNRDEILAIFGVPSQIAGSTDASSYNNVSEAKRIFWQDTVIPLLNLIIDALNNSLRDELGDGYYIGADLSGVEALRESQDSKIERANKLWEMGVPMSVINERLEMGLKEYPGWDVPFGGSKILYQGGEAPQESRSSKKPVITPEIERRREEFQGNWQLSAVALRGADPEQVAQEEERRESFASEKVAPLWDKLFANQLSELIKDDSALSQISSAEIQETLQNLSESRVSDFEKVLAAGGVEAAEQIVISKRSDNSMQLRNESFVFEQILTAIQEEALIAAELALINATTTALILREVQASRENRETVQQLKDRLSKNHAFGPQRSLAIARTLTGTASSMGQEVAAREAGASFKIWQTSALESRDGHKNRSGERVGIDERFSSQLGGSPRYPCDQQTTAADRVNCRCSMIFE